MNDTAQRASFRERFKENADIILAAFGVLSGIGAIFGWVLSMWVSDQIDAKVAELGHANTKTEVAVMRNEVTTLKSDVKDGFQEASQERRHIVDLLMKIPRPGGG